MPTVVIAALNLAASSIGNGVGVYSKGGTQFLVFVWVSFGLPVMSNFYWVVIWFVEFREFTLRVRRPPVGARIDGARAINTKNAAIFKNNISILIKSS
jgi:hypothetical protein